MKKGDKSTGYKNYQYQSSGIKIPGDEMSCNLGQTAAREAKSRGGGEKKEFLKLPKNYKIIVSVN